MNNNNNTNNNNNNQCINQSPKAFPHPLHISHRKKEDRLVLNLPLVPSLSRRNRLSRLRVNRLHRKLTSKRSLSLESRCRDPPISMAPLPYVNNNNKILMHLFDRYHQINKNKNDNNSRRTIRNNSSNTTDRMGSFSKNNNGRRHHLAISPLHLSRAFFESTQRPVATPLATFPGRR